MTRLSITILRNSAFGIAAQIAIKVLSFGFSVLIVRNLGAQVFGQYAAVLAFGMTFAIISDLGLSPYTVRQVARWRNAADGLEHANELYGNVLILRLALSFLATALLVTVAWLTGRPPLMIGAIALNAVSLFLYSIQGTSEAVLAGFERLDIAAGAKVLNQLVFVFVGAIVLWMGIGYYGLIVANLLGVALMMVACWRSVHTLGIQPRSVTIRSWPALLRAGLPFGVIGFALGLSYKFDTVLLNVYRSDLETGYYNAVYNLVFSAVVFSNAFNTALYPSLARQAISSPSTLPKIYERALRYLMVISLPIAVGMWVLADQLVPLLFKVAYLPAVPALQILTWVIPLMFASEFLGYIVVIAGKESRVAQAITISTAINVAANLVLVPRFGFLAAAAMTVATEAVLVGQYIWMLRGLMRQINWNSSLVRPLLAACLMGGMMLLLQPYVSFLACGAIGVVTYAVCLLVLGVIGKDELRFARSLRAPSEATIAQ